MSQIFSMDAQMNFGGPQLAPGAFHELLRTNFLSPPFGNCKAVVRGSMSDVTPGAGAGTLLLRIVRNPDSEAVVVATYELDPATTNTVPLFVEGIDSVPDGRDVQYSLQVEQVLGPDNLTQGLTNFIAAELISG